MKGQIDWPQALTVYFIAGTQDVRERQLPSLLEEAIASGITCFQYREKGPRALQNNREIMKMAKACQQLCHWGNIPFVVNDDVALALEIGADAVHIGQTDKNIWETIELVKPQGMAVGLSINTFEQFQEACLLNDLDYVGIGPVFQTSSKIDAEITVGLELLKETMEENQFIPKVAIGGIDLKNSSVVKATGVNGVAVISAITNSRNLEETVRILGGKS